MLTGSLVLVPRRSPAHDLPREVAAALARRGVAAARGVGTDAEERERQLETALMALFRDTRMEEAFEALYLRARQSLLAWIKHLLAGRAQASDPSEILQDTFVNVYRYASGFRDEGANTFRSWARTIAANVVRRKRMRAPGLSLQAMPADYLEPADEHGGPEHDAIVTEQSDALGRAWTILLMHYAAAFQKLNPRDRAALEMVEVQGLSYTEAGRRLKVGRSNMKMIMFRSRKRIRNLMLRAMQVDDAAGWVVRAAG